MFTLLIFENRVGQVISFFDQDVRHAELCRTRSCAYARWAGANYGNPENF